MTRQKVGGHDAEQLAMDLEDAGERLVSISKAVEERDTLRHDVKAVATELRRLKRELAEAENRVSLAVAQVCRAVVERSKAGRKGGA